MEKTCSEHKIHRFFHMVPAELTQSFACCSAPPAGQTFKNSRLSNDKRSIQKRLISKYLLRISTLWQPQKRLMCSSSEQQRRKTRPASALYKHTSNKKLISVTENSSSERWPNQAHVWQKQAKRSSLSPKNNTKGRTKTVKSHLTITLFR